MEFRRPRERALLYSILLNGFIAVVEFVGGLVSGSLALISDAMHNFSDFAALVFSLAADRMTRWNSNTKRSYGYVRFEILAAFMNSVLLVFIGAYIIYEGIARLSHPSNINSTLMLEIAFVGFAANLISVLLLREHRKTNMNIKSAFLHLVTDTLESAAVIVTAGVIALVKFFSIDSIISIAIGILILKSSWDLLRESTNILTEGSPEGIDLAEVGSFIKNFPGIKGVHHLHVWSLSSSFRALSAHIVIDDMQISRTVNITGELERQLAERYSIDHPTFQLESQPGRDCEDQLIAHYPSSRHG